MKYVRLNSDESQWISGILNSNHHGKDRAHRLIFAPTDGDTTNSLRGHPLEDKKKCGVNAVRTKTS